MALVEAHAIYALAWFSFGFGHSLLATAKAKALLVPSLGPYYRIAYNALAGIHIFAVWSVGIWLFEGISILTLPETVQTGLNGLSILGIIILVIALRGYDLGLLAGTTQIRNHQMGISEPENEPLHTDGFHAYVRHPIYSGGYLILWGNAQDDLGFAMAIWGSAYLAVGTMFEERYLLNLYGESYINYRTKVPAIIPWRAKVL